MERSRQLAAIMFTDIEGYTRLMQQNEEQAIQLRIKHREIFNSFTKIFGGRILQYFGDGTLSIFSSAIDAINCAIEMQLNFRKDPNVPVRIGIHTGDIILSDDEIIGDGVNIASRIESLALAGSILISGKVYDEIKNQKSINANFVKSINLKNVSKPIDVYAISNEGLIVPSAKDIHSKNDTKEIVNQK
ncbi:MAG: adenylate/guanylate cyclase domain-containing protein, partial [Ignavibacteriae bacterium]|nr:adenylate/guanylate cyclase domain-containing protein [Ignavibacteriota bacterium]